jgi:hypothetical protein
MSCALPLGIAVVVHVAHAQIQIFRANLEIAAVVMLALADRRHREHDLLAVRECFGAVRRDREAAEPERAVGGGVAREQAGPVGRKPDVEQTLLALTGVELADR